MSTISNPALGQCIASGDSAVVDIGNPDDLVLALFWDPMEGCDHTTAYAAGSRIGARFDGHSLIIDPGSSGSCGGHFQVDARSRETGQWIAAFTIQADGCDPSTPPPQQVPEPASVALFGIGLLVMLMGLVRRRGCRAIRSWF